MEEEKEETIKYTVKLIAMLGMAQMELFCRRNLKETDLDRLDVVKVGDLEPLDRETKLELWITKED